jgi:hypothetical protein
VAETAEKPLADERREAAETLREAAASVARAGHHPGDGQLLQLADPVADWLEETADEAERHAQGMGNTQDEIIHGPCLAVARVVNGAAS